MQEGLECGSRNRRYTDVLGCFLQSWAILSDVMSVRRAIADNLAALLELDRRASVGDAERTAYLTQAVGRDGCWVATDGNVVRGFVVVKRRHFFDRDFIDLLVVAEESRRRGPGSLLLRTGVETATSVDVFTSTNESNEPMQALLKSEGWRLSGKLDGLDKGDPELVYFLCR